MALDRFVYWRGKVPSKDELQTLLEDFMGGAGVVSWDGDRFFVNVAGKKSYPLKRQPGIGDRKQSMLDDETARPQRWIEVYVAKDNIDIMTRQQDELTNCLAEGIQQLCLRYFRAETEEGRAKRLGKT